MKNPNVFISYSWDDAQHEEWVIGLTNKLRENGIEATIDKFITQQGTTNLNRMMVENIMRSDYTIVIMTEKYAQKANVFQGGVGYETQLLTEFTKSMPNKIIPVLRRKSDNGNPIPFHLNGFEYIDFSDNNKFDDKLEILLHRIYQIDRYEKLPLGRKPDLTPKKITIELGGDKKPLNPNLIPDLKKITDLDKKNYVNRSYSDIVDTITAYANETKKANNNFEFIQETISNKKSVFKFYLNGMYKKSLKIWCDSMFGSNDGIKISYDSYSLEMDNSYNEIITCEVEGNKMILKPLMNIKNNYSSMEVSDISENIWKNIIEHLK